MENSVFLKILEYGEECGLNGTHWDDLLKNMQKDGIVASDDDLSTEETNRLFQLFDECYEKPHGSSHTHRLLKTEYYFRLIEYRELQESRLASKSANRNAFAAIGISVVAILVGVISTVVQLNSSISLDDQQLEKIVSASLPPASQEVIVDQAQLAELTKKLSRLEIKEVSLSKEQLLLIVGAINLNKQRNTDSGAIAPPPVR